VIKGFIIVLDRTIYSDDLLIPPADWVIRSPKKGERKPEVASQGKQLPDSGKICIVWKAEETETR
jgi:hypothetical protein